MLLPEEALAGVRLVVKGTRDVDGPAAADAGVDAAGGRPPPKRGCGVEGSDMVWDAMG